MRLLRSLAAELRQQRLHREQSRSDVIVLQMPEDYSPESYGFAGEAALLNGSEDELFGGPLRKGAKPEISVIRSVGRSFSVQANEVALRSIRLTHPGFRILPSTYAYLQHVRPLGEELSQNHLPETPGTQPKTLLVKVCSATGEPLEGICVRALLDWDTKAYVGGERIRTDGEGKVELRIPRVFSKVVLLAIEPEHTYWSRYLDEFALNAASSNVEVILRPVVPDSFGLYRHYAPYDENAGTGVRVGVIDCGVGPHSALNVAGGACFVLGDDASDHLDNGVGHGTHVAGIIAANRLAGTNIYGLAPASSLYSYRVCGRTDNTQKARSADIAAALERALADKCDLINISMGSPDQMPELPEMLDRARNSGAVVFAATGNDGSDRLRYPAQYSQVMAVGALGHDGSCPDDCLAALEESEIRRASEFVGTFSNHGFETDFIAPGVAVLSTFPTDRYCALSGTSMATPYMTGMAARLLGKHSELLDASRTAERADALVQLLGRSAANPGWPEGYGGYGTLR